MPKKYRKFFIVHEMVRRPMGLISTRCGKGSNKTTRNEKVTCGRCKLLAKFAAKRAKKGK